MAFQPTSAAFNYVQGLTPFAQTITFDTPTEAGGQSVTDINNIQILSVPPWLTVQNVFYNPQTNQISFKLEVNTAYADNMAEGDYTDGLYIKYTIYFGVSQATATSNNFILSLNVQHSTLLSVSPSTLPFDFLVGGPAPQNQTLQITTSSNWQLVASQNWITLSSTSGFENGQVFVGVDPTGLATGNYSGVIQVSDALNTIDVIVTLLVTEGDTDTTFLYVSPQNIQFVSELTLENTIEKTIALESSDSWTATISETWCELSSTSGVSGNTSLTISVDSVSLTDTTTPYFATIVFLSQGIQKTIYVTLYLVEFLVEGLVNETLYFADDRNKLQVTNVFPNNFLVLEAVASTGISNIPFTLRHPYQNGLAKALVGLEANQLLKPILPTNNFTSRTQNNVRPLVVNYSAFTVNRITDDSTLIDAFTNIRFLKGKTPIVSNKLCYVPSIINVSKRAVLSLSALSTVAPTDIAITGDYTGTIQTSIQDGLYVYNAILNLEALDLSPGNTINVAFSDFNYTVNIIDEVVEQTLIAFENEWQEHEIFECTGFLRIHNTAISTETQIQSEGEKETKVVSIDSGKTYEVNTGWIYTQDEKDWLSNILNSKRMFIYINNEPIQIILTTNKLEVYKTREHYKSYVLKFKKAIV